MFRLALKLYVGLLITVMALIVVHAPLQVYFGSLAPEYALYIKAWKELLMLLAVPFALIIITRANRWQELTRDKLFWLIIAYAFLHILALLQWQGLDASLAGLIIDLRYILFFALVYVLIRLEPSYRSLLLRVTVGGAIIVIGFGMLQLLLPVDALRAIGYGDTSIRPYTTVDRNDDFIRYQSTLRGPNPYGAYAASVAVIALAWVSMRLRRETLQIWLVSILGVLALLATYLSHSRSAFLAAGLGIAVVSAVRFGRRIKPLYWAGLVGLALVGAVGIYALRDNYVVSNVLFHEDPVGGSAISSNDDHLKSLIEGSEAVLSDPLGDGVGSSGSASIIGGNANIIENQYLMIAHETGWLGLILFMVVFAVVLYRLWLRRSDPWALGTLASGLGLALIGVLLPVWADDTVSIVWWGLAGILLVGEIDGKRPTKQKTTRTT